MSHINEFTISGVAGKTGIQTLEKLGTKFVWANVTVADGPRIQSFPMRAWEGDEHYETLTSLEEGRKILVRGALRRDIWGQKPNIQDRMYLVPSEITDVE